MDNDPQEAMKNFAHEMLHDSPASRKMMQLWHVNDLDNLTRLNYWHSWPQEYEEGQTDEARFVKGSVVGIFHFIAAITEYLQTSTGSRWPHKVQFCPIKYSVTGTGIEPIRHIQPQNMSDRTQHSFSLSSIAACRISGIQR